MADEEKPAAEPEAKKSKKGLVAGVAVALFLIVGAVTVGLVGLPGQKQEEVVVPADPVLATVDMPVPQLLVNLADRGAHRLLQSTTTLELSTPDELATSGRFNDLLPRVQDQMIKLMSSYHVEELEGGANKEFLQVRVKDHLNATVFAEDAEKVTQVFFTEFVIQ